MFWDFLPVWMLWVFGFPTIIMFSFMIFRIFLIVVYDLFDRNDSECPGGEKVSGDIPKSNWGVVPVGKKNEWWQ